MVVVEEEEEAATNQQEQQREAQEILQTRLSTRSSRTWTVWRSLASGSFLATGKLSIKCHLRQYLFFSPAKDCVSVPGMEDVSPEELR